MTSKFGAARLKASYTHPYFATALCSLLPVEANIPTFAVDEYWRLYVGKSALELWSVEETASVLIHEVWHLLREHFVRAKALNPEKERWLVAADLEINDDLVSEGLSLPDPVVPGRKPFEGLQSNLMAEEYYDLLPSSVKAPQGCGSGAHGKEEPWDLGPPNQGSPGLSGLETKAIAVATAEAIRKYPGKLPAGFKRWAQEMLEDGKVDWRKELPALIRRAQTLESGKVDYTYRKQSRRQTISPNIILPAIAKPTPSAAIIADTSGSMDESLLGMALAEIKSILRSTGQQGVTVLAVDAAVHSCKRVFKVDQVSLLGGGGTDMGVGIAKAMELRPKPETLIVLTDGYTPWPNDPPNAKVIVVILGGKNSGPPWAKSIKVEK